MGWRVRSQVQDILDACVTYQSKKKKNEPFMSIRERETKKRLIISVIEMYY
jgi:hypothetical protein